MGARHEVLSAMPIPLVVYQTCRVVMLNWTDRLCDTLELGIVIHCGKRTRTRWGMSVELPRALAGGRTAMG